ncbi:flagellar biosynthesis protein FlhA [Thiohalobacter thiocyanaticus]|uniref:Flagellar biosynthesis protein FlhA n=1 Tax=Thiohalobacter thiocyanaticus TaxID=585455 RepID=A0A1Z4VQH2_9GAMM|nr:flagellar biosynthesis protein FlhA [Thiohalobacter thiocyanaticus]BAZ93889.1 flagellar biosynthesis protein FlhA [Thiohalobacter thiocyanaticus]
MEQVLNTMKELGRNGLGAPVLLVLMLAMVVVPLPPLGLDMLFTFNISLSLIVLMVTIYAMRPLDFGIFPTVLLIATLMRLALNIASTRVVLLEGHTGTDAAGKVIEAFGEFVIGGNYAVGLVVFAILVIINFVVVTKGAGRVSEVSARFTLDAMPGKQMAIDADLNAGLISQDEARNKREEITAEADFYGSMDGASKFVRGDAIAGILILFINILGGLGIGMLQHDMAFADAMRNYTLLTIGDGLVAQIPSLVLSTATAIIVTRVNSSQNMSSQVLSQLFENPASLGVTSAVIGLLGLIPGMPNFAFLTLAAIGGAATWWLSQRRRQPVAEEAPPEEPETPPEARDLSWDDVAPVDIIGLEVGYRLIPLVDRNQGGQLMDRIKGVRKKLSQELGFLIQPVHIRDNLDLGPSAYRITLNGVPVGEGDIQPERELAINPGQVYGSVPGTATTEPAFGLEAVWIDPDQHDNAQTLGYTVVDASTVVATHLSSLLQQHASELLGHEEVQQLLDTLARTSPKLVEDLVPNTLPLGTVVKVLQNLLEERIPIRDMRSIAETLAEHAGRTQDAGNLTASVRVALGRSIVQHINGLQHELPVIALDPSLEQILLQSLQGTQEGGAGFEPGLAEHLHQALANRTQQQEMNGQPAVLLVAPPVRNWLARLFRHSIPGLHVLAYDEVPDNKQIKVVATVGQAPAGLQQQAAPA